MRKLLAGSLIALLVFLLLCELTLPGLAERAIENEVARSSLHPQGVKARLFAFPAAKVLMGRFDGIDLELRGVSLGGCRTSLLTVCIPQGSVDLAELLHDGGKLALRTSSPIKLRLILSEEDLNNYLSTLQMPGLKSPELELNSRYVKLKGKVGILGTSFAVQMWGDFRVDENGEIVFSPLDVRVGSESLPPGLSHQLASHLRFGLSGSRLPFAVTVKDVKIEQGCLVITGEGSGSPDEQKDFFLE